MTRGVSSVRIGKVANFSRKGRLNRKHECLLSSGRRTRMARFGAAPGGQPQKSHFVR
ncbi:hypothetical protein LFML04_1345 [Leptospirillum ferriphilum ML-04]|uniref:Uncharacterized protein n=1 Tax=Leptospirillum ferriphilum (strain ML-04) TaxID=1048260 RepID=J9ZAK0_LEPFM|nr:hypothetical protein LFML04_1345 [Leptospirillum ferriphilum ML-04]